MTLTPEQRKLIRRFRLQRGAGGWDFDPHDGFKTPVSEHRRHSAAVRHLDRCNELASETAHL